LKNIERLNFMKICLVGAELFHPGGWTDRQRHRTKLIVTFCNYANTPKNEPRQLTKIT